MINFKTGQKVDVFLYGDTKRKIPFDRAVISDRGDKLNDPDILRLTIYKGRSVVGWGYYNREWIKPQKK